MTTGHLVHECEQAIAAALDKVESVEFLYLSPADKAASLVQLHRLETRVAATRLRMLAVSGDVAEESGARDVGAWLRLATRSDRGHARRAMTLAQALDRRWSALAEAHTAGDVSTAQADVIARVLDELPDDVGAEVLTPVFHEGGAVATRPGPELGLGGAGHRCRRSPHRRREA
ncbi:DUF222 domain-containing protein [Nocardioides sp.]|uniref:DUF222 domain-containing protein n=1 Tax=Nocardioides sp. TaxID=35761 RepID=UPI00286E20B0|nr:DUF222 domain-containing protein [Nocardioides sp.]